MAEVRIPPHNEEAERAVLGGLLIDPAAILQVAEFLRPGHFYSPNHGKVYEAILGLYDQREPIDMVTVPTRLKKMKALEKIGGTAFLTNLASETPTAANIETYGRMIKDTATKRSLISASAKIAEIGFADQDNVNEALDQAEQEIFSISQDYLSQEFVPIRNVLEQSFDRLDELHRKKGSLRGVPTGLKSLDKMLSGLQEGNLVILAARPSIGKSSLATGFAQWAATKHKIPVGFFSLEMSAQQLTDRMLSAQSDVDNWKITTGNLDDDDFKAIGEAMGVLAEAPIFIDDTPGISVMEMRTKARRLKLDKNVGLLIVDYLQLVRGRGLENRVQEVSEISQSLKALARELEVPLVACSQLSRAIEQRGSRTPQLSDLRDSGCLTGDSQVLNLSRGGESPIRDLVGSRPFETLCLDEQMKLQQGKVTKVFPSGVKPVFELKLTSGKFIKASANHKFYTKRGWQRLDQLNVGERLAILSDKISPIASGVSSAWDTITSISERGEEEVYDATVEIHHNFVANNIVVHNSIEQDADVVMFLYRPNEEDRQNIKLLISKHRSGPTGEIELFFRGERTKFYEAESVRE